MSFEFQLPVNRDDLLRRSGVNQYVVDEVFAIKSLTSKLKECQMAFRTGGPMVILSHFDTFFSVIVHFNGVDMDTKETAWRLILNFVQALGGTLADFVERQNIAAVEKMEQLNGLKMAAYLLCQMMEHWELSTIEASNTLSLIAGRGKKKAIKAVGKGRGGGDRVQLTADWDEEREKAIKALLQILQLSINRLWDPPIAEEEFINMVTNLCYKLLETQTGVKGKLIREAIFHLLGVCVKRYNHSMGCTLKLLQLLQQNEQLAQPCAAAVQLIVDSYGVRGIVSEIMREIGRMDGKELARDTSGTRAYAAFLLELSRCVPASVLPNISVVLVLLDEESYTMRNSVLGMIGELIVRLLSGDSLDSKQKLTRDQLLDKLEEHIHDVNAFVRSKVLQIWFYIISENALPLPKHLPLLKLTIVRLQDKSCVVRKSALQLFSALLRINLLAARLTAEELTKNYEKELSKLKEMAPHESHASTESNGEGYDSVQHGEKLRAAMEEWKSLEVKLILYFTKSTQTSSDADDDDDERVEEEEEEESIEEEETEERVMSRIVTLLTAQRFKGAVALLKTAGEQWPLNPCFQGASAPPPSSLEDGSMEEEEEEASRGGGLDSEATTVISGLKSVYLVHKMETVITEEIRGDGSAHSAPPPAADANNSVVNELSKQKVLVQFLKNSMEFVTEIEKGVVVACMLLGSKTATDVLEAIDFFVSGVETGVSSCREGVRKMLPLVWSKEASIKDAVTDAYKRVYLSSHQTASNNPRAQAVATANALISLTKGGTTLGDLTSLEELVKQFVKAGDLGPKVVQVLWEKFALKLPNTSPGESRGALVLLGMVAGAKPETVRSNITTLISEGLGERGEQDYLLARDTCVAFSKLSIQPKSARPYRLKTNHDLFKRLSDLLVNGLLETERSYWIPLAEEAVSLIYKLAENPDVICADIIKCQASSVVGLSSKRGDMTDVLDLVLDDPPASENAASTDGDLKADQSEPLAGLPSVVLTRFLFLCGHVAFKQLLHLDVSVFGEMKRRHVLQDNNGDIRSSGNSSSRKSGGASVAASAVKQAKEATAEEEMGLAGATAEDAEAEFIRKVVETQVVTGSSNLLSVLSPLVVSVCTNQSRFTDPDLRTSASLALYKYMTVSSEFCEEHLPLLFTLLEKSPQASVRANTIIALGDLTFRFPNLIEPWTPNMYARLRDSSILVRKNTLTVLTHLILRDMIKVKGQISEMVVCVIDEDLQISGLAKHFFQEFSKKGNAIYNILPDIISRLSDAEVGVEEEKFRVILKYLMSFIQKDKQCESLVEKICHRFRVNGVERHWRDLAYCLSLLQYSDKSVRKLQENFSCFADKLVEDSVYDSFLSVVTSARKICKPESKVLLDEFEQRLEEARTKGVREDDAATSAAAAGAKLSRTVNKKSAGVRKQKSEKKKLELTDSDDDDDVEEEDAAAGSSRQPTTGARAASSRAAAAANKKKAKPVFDLTMSSDEESNDFSLSKPANTGATKRGKRTLVSSASDDDDQSEARVMNMRGKSVCNRAVARASRSARKK